MSAAAPTYAELAAPLYPAAPRERLLVGLMRQDAEDKKEDGEYETRRSFVLARIERQLAAGGRAMRAAGIDPRAPGRPAVSGPSSDVEAIFAIPAPSAGIDPVWTYRQRQAALCAVFEGDDARLNAAADCLRDDMVREATHQPHGPWMDLSQLEEGDEAGVGNPAGLALLHFEAEDSLNRLIVREGGRIIEAGLAAEAEAAFRLNIDYTEKLADACERGGMRVRFVDVGEDNPEGRKVRPSVTFVPFGEPSRAIKLPNVQRLNFFPSVAAARRAPIARALAYLLDRTPYARMATLTSGPRNRPDAQLPRLREGTKAFHQRLGWLFKHRWFTRHVSLLLRASEFGTPKAGADAWQLDGGMPVASALRWNFNIHSHIIYVPERRADGRMWSREQWSRFREWIRLRLAAFARYQEAKAEAEKTTWDAFRAADRRACHAARSADPEHRQAQHHAELGLMIKKAAEAVKYPMKNTDLEEMVDLGGPGVVVEFAAQTRGLHLIQPHGELAALLRRLKERGERIVRESTPEGGVRIIARDWNRPAPTNPNARDFMGGKGRAARLARLRRALRPESIARRHRKLSRATERRARDLIRKIEAESDRLARLAQKITTAEAARDYWTARASAWLLENRAEAVHRAEEKQAAAAARLEDAAAARADVAAKEKALAREFVRMLETFPHALHACGIDALPAAVLRLMERMGAFCALSENEEKDAATAEKTTEPAAPRPLRNRVLAITQPCAIGGARVTQPFAVVVGYCGDFERLRGQSARVSELAHATCAQLAAGLRIAAEIDAVKPARAARRPLHGSHYPPNFPRGSGAESVPPPVQAEFSGLAEPVLTALAAL